MTHKVGKVTLGGVELNQFDPNELRKQMALVPQQPALFSNDVFHNIRYGNPQATDAQVIEAAKKRTRTSSFRTYLKAITAFLVNVA